SDIRIAIVKLLNQRKLNIVDIAKELDLPVSTVASNIRILERSGIISTDAQPGKRGTMKVCSRNFDDIRLRLNETIYYKNTKNCYQIEMPIGQYTNYDISPTCGIINNDGVIRPIDEPSMFF